MQRNSIQTKLIRFDETYFKILIYSGMRSLGDEVCERLRKIILVNFPLTKIIKANKRKVLKLERNQYMPPLHFLSSIFLVFLYQAFRAILRDNSLPFRFCKMIEIYCKFICINCKLSIQIAN